MMTYENWFYMIRNYLFILAFAFPANLYSQCSYAQFVEVGHVDSLWQFAGVSMNEIVDTSLVWMNINEYTVIIMNQSEPNLPPIIRDVEMKLLHVRYLRSTNQFILIGSSWDGTGKIYIYDAKFGSFESFTYPGLIFNSVASNSKSIIVGSDGKVIIFDYADLKYTSVKVPVDKVWAVAATEYTICAAGSYGEIAIVNGAKIIKPKIENLPEEYWRILAYKNYYVAASENDIYLFNENGDYITCANYKKRISGIYIDSETEFIVIIGGNGELVYCSPSNLEMICSELLFKPSLKESEELHQNLIENKVTKRVVKIGSDLPQEGVSLNCSEQINDIDLDIENNLVACTESGKLLLYDSSYKLLSNRQLSKLPLLGVTTDFKYGTCLTWSKYEVIQTMDKDLNWGYKEVEEAGNVQLSFSVDGRQIYHLRQWNPDSSSMYSVVMRSDCTPFKSNFLQKKRFPKGIVISWQDSIRFIAPYKYKKLAVINSQNELLLYGLNKHGGYLHKYDSILSLDYNNNAVFALFRNGNIYKDLNFSKPVFRFDIIDDDIYHLQISENGAYGSVSHGNEVMALNLNSHEIISHYFIGSNEAYMDHDIDNNGIVHLLLCEGCGSSQTKMASQLSIDLAVIDVLYLSDTKNLWLLLNNRTIVKYQLQ